MGGKTFCFGSHSRCRWRNKCWFFTLKICQVLCNPDLDTRVRPSGSMRGYSTTDRISKPLLARLRHLHQNYLFAPVHAHFFEQANAGGIKLLFLARFDVGEVERFDHLIE
jgi:hypothetical protein